MGLTEHLTSRREPHWIAVGAYLLRCQRVDGLRLQLAGGIAELPGAADADRALRAEQRAQIEDLRRKLAQAKGKQARAELEEQLAEAQRTQTEELMRRALSTPERALAVAERLDAYICASVDRGGLLTDEARAELTAPVEGGEARIQVVAADVAEGLVADGELDDLRLVTDQDDHDPEASPPRLWVGLLPTSVRSRLGFMVTALQDASAEVRPFRPASGAAAAAGQAGEEVSPDAA